MPSRTHNPPHFAIDTQPTMTLLPADTPVEWFSESSRVIDGRPDARYGWAESPDGPCIVKALDLRLGPSVASLLDHERDVLKLLGDRGAPVPQLVQTEAPGWLATRFGGLSLRVLAGLPGAPEHLSFDERLAVWVHFLRRAEAFVTAGALPIDLWDGNIVLPLTRGVAGQVMPQDAVMIDHAHTVVTGMHLRRPVMIGAHMDRIAPELREFLEADQVRFVHAFREANAPFPQTTAAMHDLEARSAQIFTNYDADQQVQQALDDGKLDIAAAMQYAAAVAVERLLPMAPPAARQPLFEVLRRMKAEAPQARFATLTEASEALRRVMPALPRTGRHQYPEVRPATLKPLPVPETPVDAPMPGEGTFSADQPTQRTSGAIVDFINIEEMPAAVPPPPASPPPPAQPTSYGSASTVEPIMKPADEPAAAAAGLPWRWLYAAGLIAGGLLGQWAATRGL